MITLQVIQVDNIILWGMSYLLAHHRQLQFMLIIWFYFEGVYCFKFNLKSVTVFLFIFFYFLFLFCFFVFINLISHLKKFFRNLNFVRLIFQKVKLDLKVNFHLLVIFKENLFFQAIHNMLFIVLIKFFTPLELLLIHDFDYFEDLHIDSTNYNMLLHIVVQEFKFL